MKNASGPVFIFLFFLFLAAGCMRQDNNNILTLPAAKYIVLANFDNIGKDIVDTWNYIPDSLETSIQAEIENKILKITYDVISEDYTCNGISLDLGGKDFSLYKTLLIIAKGDRAAGFPEILTLEMFNKERKLNTFFLSGLTERWNTFAVPIKKFGVLSELSDLQEFRVVFCSRNTVPGTGVVYIKGVYLEKRKESAL